MIRFFFPASAFGWLFAAVLLAFLVAASWSDLRRLVVPKGITLTTLGVGLLANMIRGAWLGAVALPVWVLPGGGGFGLGLLDGLLFGLAGAAAAFAVMFALWILGVCGGGDVKLYAAVGAWVGPWNIFAVLILAAGCLMLVGLAAVIAKVLRGKAAVGGTEKASKSRLVAFSWPLTVGTLLVLAFLVGHDIMTARTLQKAAANQVHNDAR